MRKALLPLLILALCSSAASATATAATPKPGPWKGTKVDLGSNLEFKVSKNGKRIVGISATLLERCSGSSTTSYTTFLPKSSWKINKRGRFSGRHKETYGALSLYYTVKGRFTSANRASGVLRQQSVITGTWCDTYELKFKARHGR